MPEWVPAWFLDWAQSVTMFDLLLWVVGGVGVIIFVRKGWPWLKRSARAVINFATIVDAVQELPAFIERTDSTLKAQNAQIADIHHEVHYNNGTSVKDGVQRLETGMAAVHAEVATVAFDLAQAKEALTLSEGRVRQDLEERRALEDTRSDDGDGTPKRT